jgi:hypothetical protein
MKTHSEKFNFLPSGSSTEADEPFLRTRGKERATPKSAQHENRMADKASPRFLVDGSLDTARITPSLAEHGNFEQNQLLRHISLAQQDLSTRDQLLRLQALNSNNSWTHPFQQLVFPQSGLNSDVSQILAQRMLLSQQQSSLSSALYDRLSSSTPGGGRWNPTQHPTMKLEDAAKIQKEVIRQALHEQESKRLKEIEYAQRLALSVTPPMSDIQHNSPLYSRIGAPRIGGNPLYASLKNSPIPPSTNITAARRGIADRGMREHPVPAKKPTNKSPPA